MFTLLFRTAILYALVLITMRIMGKRQVGQLEPFELTITIMISELASLPMQDAKIPLINGIIPIITLLILEVTIAFIQLKSERSRSILSGTPSILIKNGEIDIKEMKVQQFNLNDLLEELRLQGYFNIADIEYAILETSGQVSVMPKNNKTSSTKEDLSIKYKKCNLPVTLIMDGNVQTANLKYIEKNSSWLEKQLDTHNLHDPQSVFLAYLDTEGKFKYQKKDDAK